MGRRFHRTSSTRALLALLLYTGAAHGQAPAKGPSARALFDEGRGHFQNGRYDQAIQALERAYVLQPDPLILLNIGRSHQRAGRFREAIGHYERCLQQAPLPSVRDSAIAYRSEVTALLAPPPPRPIVALPVSPRRPPAVPLHRRAWFWGALGAAVAGVGTGLALGLHYGRQPAAASGDLGTFGIQF